MLTRTQEQILIFLLSNPEEQLTIRGTAKRLGKSYSLVYNNLADLEKKNIIRKQNIPPGQIVRLNKFAPVYVFVDLELERKKEFLKRYPWIEVMLDDIFKSSRSLFFILVVFGSYAKKTETKRSDLDLLVIVQEKREIKDIENAIRGVYTKVKKALNFIDVNDFKEMIINSDALNIGNEARKYHILLYGIEEYYQLLNKVYRK